MKLEIKLNCCSKVFSIHYLPTIIEQSIQNSDYLHNQDNEYASPKYPDMHFNTLFTDVFAFSKLKKRSAFHHSKLLTL